MKLMFWAPDKQLGFFFLVEPGFSYGPVWAFKQPTNWQNTQAELVLDHVEVGWQASPSFLSHPPTFFWEDTFCVN